MGIREIRIATERKREKEKETMGADFNVLYIKI